MPVHPPRLEGICLPRLHYEEVRMRLCHFMIPFACPISITVIADATFLDVRTRLREDHRGATEQPGKYFRESDFHAHYDGRFGEMVVRSDERQLLLRNLLHTFASTMSDLGVSVWVAHGALLGWWWNHKLFPWDDGVDMQIELQSLMFLAEYYNMTEYHFRMPGRHRRRSYLLEINPHYTDRHTHDQLNRIDARWIDTDNGLFVDITAVSPAPTDPDAGGTAPNILMSKDGHRYLVSIADGTRKVERC